MKLTLAIGVVALASILILWIGSLIQRQSASRLAEALAVTTSSEDALGGKRIAFDSLDSLAEPVAQYLRHVLQDGQPLITVARLRQSGELRTDVRNNRWLSFTASQVIAPLSPGFIWDAKVAIAPLLHVRVRDAYVGGRGSGQVAFLSALTIAAESAGVEMNAASLHRYLAEAVWYPTALLPSSTLKWAPIDRTRALATLTSGGTSVSLEFWFDDTYQVSGIYSPRRWEKVDGGFRQTPWEGHFRNYVRRDGMMVPSEGEVGWHSSGQWQCVWRGKLLEGRYDFAP